MSALNAWIEARRAEGYSIYVCPSCGIFFAQLAGRLGRKPIFCGLHRCELWRRYQHKNGRAPPDWLVMKWKSEQGDKPNPKSKPMDCKPRWRCGVAA